MTPQFFIDDRRLTEVLDAVTPNVRQKLERTLGPIGAEIAADANARTAAHIRFVGAKNAGTLATSFKGGLAKPKDKNKIAGFARSGHPLAHLMEYGFRITDLMIQAKAGEVLKFAGDAGEVFRRIVHRHETQVKPYPALGPAFEARRGEIMAALEEAAKSPRAP